MALTILSPWIPKNQNTCTIIEIKSTDGREPVPLISGWKMVNTSDVSPAPVRFVIRPLMILKNTTFNIKGISTLNGAATLDGTLSGILIVILWDIKKRLISTTRIDISIPPNIYPAPKTVIFMVFVDRSTPPHTTRNTSRAETRLLRPFIAYDSASLYAILATTYTDRQPIVR